MRTSESTKELIAALAKAQGEFPKIARDSENPFYKSRYADLSSILSAVQEPLGKQGLAVTQHLESEFQSYYDADGTVKGERMVLCVITRLEHTSGEFEESTLRVPLMDSKPQTMGSASSYMRRYALQSVLRIAAESEDDGNAASLQERWTKKTRDDYVEEKKAKLQQDIEQQQGVKSNFKKQLQASVEDLAEEKQMDEEQKPRPQPKMSEMITGLQKKMVFAICQKRGLSDGDMLDHLGSIGYEHLSEVPKDRVNQLLDSIDPEYKFHSQSTFQQSYKPQ